MFLKKLMLFSKIIIINRLALILSILIFAHFLSIIVYIYIAAPDNIIGDTYRFVYMFYDALIVNPIKDINILWADHHPMPLVALIFIGNAVFFGINHSLEIYVYMFIGVIAYILICRLFARILFPLDSDSDLNKKLLIYLSLALIFFSFASTRQYYWSCVSNYYLVNLFTFASTYILYLYLACDTRTTNYKHQCLIFSFFLLCGILSRDYFTIFTTSVILMSLPGAIYLKSKQYLILSVLVFTTTILAFSIVWYIKSGDAMDSTRVDVVSNSIHLLSNTALFLKSFVYAIPSGLFYYKQVDYGFISEAGIWRESMIYGLFIIYLSVFIHSLYSNYKRHFVFNLFMLIPFVHITTTIIFRYNYETFDHFYVVAGRYVPLYQLGWIGFLGNTASILLSSKHKWNKQITAIALLTLISLDSIAMNYWYVHSKQKNNFDYFKTRDSYRYMQEKNEELLSNGFINIPQTIIALPIMKRDDLNIFRANYGDNYSINCNFKISKIKLTKIDSSNKHMLALVVLDYNFESRPLIDFISNGEYLNFTATDNKIRIPLSQKEYQGHPISLICYTRNGIVKLENDLLNYLIM